MRLGRERPRKVERAVVAATPIAGASMRLGRERPRKVLSGLEKREDPDASMRLGRERPRKGPR